MHLKVARTIQLSADTICFDLNLTLDFLLNFMLALPPKCQLKKGEDFRNKIMKYSAIHRLLAALLISYDSACLYSSSF